MTPFDKGREPTRNGKPLTDNEAAIAFLQRVLPGGPWALTSIQSDGKKRTQTITLHPSEEDDLRGWLQQFNGHRNIYWHVNPVREDITSKARKEDIARVVMLHVDIDPADGRDIGEEKARAIKMLQEGRDDVPPPTIIIDSGGGVQAFWELVEPMELGSIDQAEDAERYNKTIQNAFGGDHCFNIDRIMRLPGTINIPDAKKAAKGRTRALARILEDHPERRYLISRFAQAPAKPRQSDFSDHQVANSHVELVDDLSVLDKWGVPDRIKEIVANGHARASEGRKSRDDSRSAWLFDAVCALKRHEVPDEITYALITDPRHGVSASVLECPNPTAYAARQIAQAAAALRTSFVTDKHNTPYNISENMRVALRLLNVNVSFDEFAGRHFVEGLDDID